MLQISKVISTTFPNDIYILQNIFNTHSRLQMISPSIILLYVTDGMVHFIALKT